MPMGHERGRLLERRMHTWKIDREHKCNFLDKLRSCLLRERVGVAGVPCCCHHPTNSSTVCRWSRCHSFLVMLNWSNCIVCCFLPQGLLPAASSKVPTCTQSYQAQVSSSATTPPPTLLPRTNFLSECLPARIPQLSTTFNRTVCRTPYRGR
jgi:hypothetical protein